MGRGRGGGGDGLYKEGRRGFEEIGAMGDSGDEARNPLDYGRERRMREKA